MKTTLLFLLLRLYFTSAQSRATLIVSPSSSQFFEYNSVSLICDHSSSDEWTVWRYTSRTKLELSSCNSGWGNPTPSRCDIKAIKPLDSGMYWCESKYRDSSNMVNITIITDKGVILQSPAGLVTEGDNITLNCKEQNTNNLQAEFYRNNFSLSTKPEGNMTIHQVSKSNEGEYKCRMSENKSSPSWLLIEDGLDPAVLTVSPDSSQTFEYKILNLSCRHDRSSHGWRIARVTLDHKLSHCGVGWGTPSSSGCFIQTAKKTDSAVYWCESATRQRSNSVNFTVHHGNVTLQTPLRPLTEGDNVTLLCKTKTSHTLPCDFYKDGAHVKTEPAGHMTIHGVSTSDEGLYWCHIAGYGESPPSWLFVRGSNSSPSPSALTIILIRLPVVVAPFAICTVLALFSCRHTGRNLPAEDCEGSEQPYDDVIAEVTTEHQF
ncbi:low affinity immunoglobulin gamma Fc region receptor III-A isoform X1 [Labrus bergylta]|uniref:low affinity immunoglobulin gamma Fc region receptor III-A isoform X1 n=1 Tax=Labrus bergylta TaxID=56723 RepID=UPI003313C95E